MTFLLAHQKPCKGFCKFLSQGICVPLAALPRPEIANSEATP